MVKVNTMDVSSMFKDLPNEIKLFIFSFFNRLELNAKVSKTCKEWRRLSADPCLWRKLVYENGNKNLPLDVKTKAINRNHFVRSVVFASKCDLDWIDGIVQHNSTLNIQFIGCPLTEQTVSKLTKIFPSVETLWVDSCDTLGCDRVLQLTRNLKNIKHLRLTGMSREYVSTYIPLIVEQIEMIEVLDLQFCFQMDDRTLQFLIEQRGRNLKYFALDFREITTQSYRLLSVSCVNLTSLHLYNQYSMEDGDLVILTNLKSLEILRIGSAERLFSHNFTAIFGNSKFSNLTQLSADYCFNFRDDHLQILVANCPKLKHLIIRNSDRISDKGLMNLPTTCGTLELLELTVVERVSEEFLEKLVVQMPHLHCCYIKRHPLADGVTRKHHSWYGKKRTCRITKIINQTNPPWNYCYDK